MPHNFLTDLLGMELPKLLRLPRGRRRGRGRVGGGVSLVEGQGGVNPTILGGSPSTLSTLGRCYQPSIVSQHFPSLSGYGHTRYPQTYFRYDPRASTTYHPVNQPFTLAGLLRTSPLRQGANTSSEPSSH